MDDIEKAIELTEQNEAEKAYDILSSAIDDSKHGYIARYNRAMIDISKLRSHLDETKKDLLYLIDKKTIFKNDSYAILTLLYDEEDDISNVKKYGSIAKKLKTNFNKEVNFALARALARTKIVDDLNKALESIDECINCSNDDVPLDYYVCKTDILISMDNFDEAEKILNLVLNNYGYSAVYYYLNSRFYIKKYHFLVDSNKDFKNHLNLIEKCIDNALIVLRYEENDYPTKIILIEAYTICEKYEDAINVINTFESTDDEEDVLMEKIKVFDVSKQYKRGLDLIKNYLKLHTSWKIKYMEGAFTVSLDNSEDNIKYAISCFKDAYSIFPNNGIIYDIIKFNRIINNEHDSYDFINSYIENDVDGTLNFIQAENALRLGKEYSEIINYYKKSHELGYLSEFEYNDAICNYIEFPKTIAKAIKKDEKKALKSVLPWSKRKVAIRYLYGEDGYKQNAKTANKILSELIKNFGEDPCTLSLFGRSFELLGKNDLAYKYYKEAYDEIYDTDEIDCDCSYGYYAHALFSGIGTNQNIEGAKVAILDAIKAKGKFTCSHIVYYYAYFYLSGDERFNGNFAKELLEFNYPFYRYDISRIIYLQKVAKKLHYVSPVLDMLMQTMNMYDKDEIKYFNKAINEQLPLPYWRTI